MKIKRQNLIAAVLIVALLGVMMYGLSLRPEAISGNIDVDKAKPIINQTIDNIMQNPYQPTPWEQFSWWLRDIFDWWCGRR